jgi:molybdopterin-guanine dinucleotide biosynthesis protein A
MTVAGVAGAILAGGKATRMGGQPKSFLVVDGRRIIDRQLEVLRPLFAELLISANDAAAYAPFGVPVHADAIPDQGPLSGILAVIEASRAPSVVAVACDMPWLSAEALRLLAETAPEADVVVPVVGGRPEPLFARYGKRCAAAIRARLAAGDRKIARFFDDVLTHTIEEQALRALDPTLRFLHNCNTPRDLAPPA